MVLGVLLEVLGESVDTPAQNGDLDLGTSRVPLMRLELLDQILLPLGGQRHLVGLLAIATPRGDPTRTGSKSLTASEDIVPRSRRAGEGPDLTPRPHLTGGARAPDPHRRRSARAMPRPRRTASPPAAGARGKG